jgi:four helix bundle protein
MLNIYPVALRLGAVASVIAKQIAPHDRDLASQMKRASTGVSLKIAEGSYSKGGNRRELYHRALGSARETLACAEQAHACSYITFIDPELVRLANQVIGTLVNVLKK